MLTAFAAAMLTASLAAPQAEQPTTVKTTGAFSAAARNTIAAVAPTPGAWVLMGLGGLALIRASRKPKTDH